MNKTYYVAGIPFSGDHLAHGRTVGSKNGVRRFQNEDGSLTPLGRIHYGVGQGRVGKGGNAIYTDGGGTTRRAKSVSGYGGSTASSGRGRALIREDLTSKSFDNAPTEYDPLTQLPDYGKPGHKFRYLSEAEYNQLMAQSQGAGSTSTVKDIANDILYGLSNATVESVQTSVNSGKKLVDKNKKKKAKRVMSTNSARTLNERTKNLTDLKDQKLLRDYMK